MSLNQTVRIDIKHKKKNVQSPKTFQFQSGTHLFVPTPALKLFPKDASRLHTKLVMHRKIILVFLKCYEDTKHQIINLLTSLKFIHYNKAVTQSETLDFP